MATYAIGDIHGCLETLTALVSRLPFQRATDRLWLVGDLVNRGPGSLGVLRWARALAAEMGERMTVVLGNHDVHLLALAAGFGRPAHRRYLDEVLDASDGAELVDWLRRRPLLERRLLANRDHLLIHAGLLPAWTAGVAEDRARRAEAFLRRGDGLEKLMAPAPVAGAVVEERETLAALTRLRMLAPDGSFCSHTGTPEDAPDGCVSWFDREDRASRDCVIVAGHWAALGHRLRPDLVALDSGCVYGGGLTAVRLEDREVFTLPSRER